MSKTPFHYRVRHTARHITVLLVALALIVTPFIVALTHGPASDTVASFDTAFSDTGETQEQGAQGQRAKDSATQRQAQSRSHSQSHAAVHGHGPVHGHSHSHTHAHEDTGDDRQDAPSGAHNPADHDHQFQGLVNQTATPLHPLPDTAPSAFGGTFRHLTPEGPRRPPRMV